MSLEQTVHDYVESWTERDPARRADLFTEDARVLAPTATTPIVGKPAIKAWWRQLETKHDFVDLWLIDLVDRGVEGLFVFEATLGAAGGAATRKIRVYEVIELDETGLIRSLTSYPSQISAPVGIGVGPL